MVRAGERSSGFREASWGEALKLVASRLKESRNNGEPERFVRLDGHVRGNMLSYAVRPHELQVLNTPVITNTPMLNPLAIVALSGLVALFFRKLLQS